jgi:predicted trehalose synthase
VAKKIGELNEGDIKKIRSESIGLVNDLDSIGKSINSSLQKVSELTGESVKSFKEGFNAANALGDAIAKVDSQTLASKKQQTAFQDKVRKATEEATKLEAKATRLRQESVNFTKKQAQEAYKVARYYEDGADKLREQTIQAEKITDQFEKLNNQTKQKVKVLVTNYLVLFPSRLNRRLLEKSILN